MTGISRDDGKRWLDLRHAELLPLLRYQVGDRLWVKEEWQVVRETLDYETGGEWDCFEWEGTLEEARECLDGSPA